MKQVFLVGCLFIIFFIDLICISAVHRIRNAIDWRQRAEAGISAFRRAWN